MTHARRAPTVLSVLAAATSAGCSLKPPAIPMPDFSLFKSEEPAATKIAHPQDTSIVPLEYQNTVVLPDGRRITRIFTRAEIEEAFAACGTTDQITAERYVALKQSHQIRYNGRYAPKQVCTEVGIKPAHDTQASGSGVYRPDPQGTPSGVTIVVVPPKSKTLVQSLGQSMGLTD